MLTRSQLKIVDELLKQDNVSEFMEYLITSYASNVKRTSRLLSLIPTISKMQLDLVNNRVIEYSQAVETLIGDRHNKGKSKDSKQDFATLLFVSKAHFPHGNCTGGSVADQEFFIKFIDAIKNKKGFDYESQEDWYWICNIVHCRDWMVQVIRQNINENFKGVEIF